MQFAHAISHHFKHNVQQFFGASLLSFIGFGIFFLFHTFSLFFLSNWLQFIHLPEYFVSDFFSIYCFLLLLLCKWRKQKNISFTIFLCKLVGTLSTEFTIGNTLWSVSWKYTLKIDFLFIKLIDKFLVQHKLILILVYFKLIKWSIDLYLVTVWIIIKLCSQKIYYRIFYGFRYATKT